MRVICIALYKCYKPNNIPKNDTQLERDKFSSFEKVNIVPVSDDTQEVV